MAKGKSDPKLAKNVQGMLKKSGYPTETPVKIGPFKKKGK